MTEETDLVELEPQQIPLHWRDIPYRIVQYAITFGLIIPGYTCKNYIEKAIEEQGYETVEIWGVQGSYKSNRTLQQGFWCFKDWDKVLKNIVFKVSAKERGFVEKLKSIPFGKRTPWIGWDDITVHYPSTTWRTDIAKYEAIDSSWASIRTKVSVITVNNPIIDRLAKNIKDNITMEMFLGRNQTELVERFVRLPGIKHVESNFFKIQVEPLHRFEPFDVPKDVFKEYWQLRIALAEEALQKLGDVYSVGEINEEGFISFENAIKELDVSPTTLDRMIARGIAHSKKIHGKIFIERESYEKNLLPYYSKHKKRPGKPRETTN